MPARICLNMIVKDETHCIKETLDAVRPYICYWIISDTGSTDGTQDFIRSYFKEAGIPGELYEDEWRDFGTNRSIALRYCWGRPEFDYVWVIDADDLVVGPLQFPLRMDRDVYQLIFGNQQRKYPRMQIFSVHKPWGYRGRIHEYAHPADGSSYTVGRIDGDYYIESRRLGARNKDPEKYLKDAHLCLEEMQAVKEHEGRYCFYAAQSFYDYGDKEKAKEYYWKRVALGGNLDERYISLLKISSIGDTVNSLMAAIQIMPERGEAPYYLAHHYNGRQEYWAAKYFIDMALKTDYNPAALFTDLDAYGPKRNILAVSIYARLEMYEKALEMADLMLARGELVDQVESLRVAILQVVGLDAYTSKPKHPVPNKPRPHLVTFVVAISGAEAQKRLERTVNSFLNCCLDADLIGRWVVIADRPGISYPGFETLVSSGSMAEKGNIARSLARTPYLLFIDDSWTFFAKREYIRPAVQVLTADDKFGQVLFNCHYLIGLGQEPSEAGVLFEFNGNRFVEHHYTGQEPSWPHFSLRPSLIKLSALQGDFEEVDNFDHKFALAYYESGKRSLFFPQVCCQYEPPSSPTVEAPLAPSETQEESRKGPEMVVEREYKLVCPVHSEITDFERRYRIPKGVRITYNREEADEVLELEGSPNFIPWEAPPPEQRIPRTEPMLGGKYVLCENDLEVVEALLYESMPVIVSPLAGWENVSLKIPVGADREKVLRGAISADLHRHALDSIRATKRELMQRGNPFLAIQV